MNLFFSHPSVIHVSMASGEPGPGTFAPLLRSRAQSRVGFSVDGRRNPRGQINWIWMVFFGLVSENESPMPVPTQHGVSNIPPCDFRIVGSSLKQQSTGYRPRRALRWPASCHSLRTNDSAWGKGYFRQGGYLEDPVWIVHPFIYLLIYIYLHSKTPELSVLSRKI